MIAYFDCFSGISGDMALGALLDAGAEAAVLDGAVEALGLGGEVRVSAHHEQRGHLGGTRVVVECGPGPRRGLPELERVVAAARLPGRVRERSLDALGRIGRAESEIHGLPRDRVHLHELGGADTLVDLVGAFWLLEALGVETLYASPLPAPRGFVGELPLPAPASLRLLAGTGAVLEPSASTEELVTPTGAAILAVAAEFRRPAMRLLRAGYGIGGRDRPGNALGLWLGEAVEPTAGVAVIETNLDDMAPNLLAALVEDLMAAGALDVSVAPALMKKGRPGHLLTVMAEPSLAQALASLVLASSTTLGVRMTQAQRVIAGRRVIEVDTAYGHVRVKVKELDGRDVDVAPEYEDCRRLSLERGARLGDVLRAAAEAARRQIGLDSDFTRAEGGLR